MRRFVVVPILLLGASFGYTQTRSFAGEIMDSQCAAMRTHSRMMAGVEAKDAKECTQKCVHMGGKYALYEPASQTAYQLDDQQKAAGFAGHKVSVKGTLNTGSRTIHVEQMNAQ